MSYYSTAEIERKVSLHLRWRCMDEWAMHCGHAACRCCVTSQHLELEQPKIRKTQCTLTVTKYLMFQSIYVSPLPLFRHASGFLPICEVLPSVAAEWLPFADFYHVTDTTKLHSGANQAFFCCGNSPLNTPLLHFTVAVC